MSAKNREKSPSEGERSALKGFYNQEKVSAFLIIDAIKTGNFSKIHLLDSTVGKLDDFVLFSGDKVDAFQIKWLDKTNYFSFKDLIRKQTKNKKKQLSLLEQLIDGWHKLIELYPTKKISVHLVINQYPSKQDRIPIGEKQPENPNFDGFFNQVLKNCFNIDKIGDIPEEWYYTWNKLKEKSNLDEKSFFQFIKSCQFDLGFKYPINDLTRDSEQLQKDINHIISTLYRLKGNPKSSTTLELDFKSLIRELGWESRFKSYYIEKFPEPSIKYIPIKKSVEEINIKMDKNKGGYLGILGSPGSGKSTLLDHIFRYSTERVIYYYAYSPDATISLRSVVEGDNFLHSLVLGVQKFGFSTGKSVITRDISLLRENFLDLLSKIAEDYVKTKKRTIFIIDGLDHVSRELNPINSFINELPLPEQIPEGIFFILGTQTENLEDLSSRIKTEITKKDRRIEIAGLLRDNVYDFMKASHLELNESQKDQIFEISDGHPLYLNYIINKILYKTEEESIDNIILSSQSYSGNIEVYYNTLWNNLSSDTEIIGFFGLICRVNGRINLSLIQRWTESKTFWKFQRKFYHLFKISGNFCFFFHNSFRSFLLIKTIELSPNNYDNDMDKEYHKKLAELYSINSIDFMLEKYNIFFHLMKSEQYNQVFNLCNQNWFREQYNHFRPKELIEEDLKNFAIISLTNENLIGFIRAILARLELNNKKYHINPIDIIPILLKLNKNQSGLNLIYNSNKLLVEKEEGIKLSNILHKNGMINESYTVFKLSEPLDILSGERKLKLFHDEIDKIHNWIKIALKFSNYEKIIGILSKIVFEKPELKNETILYCKFTIIREFIKKDDWKKVNKLYDTLDDSNIKNIADILIDLWNSAVLSNNEDYAKKYFQLFVEKVEGRRTNNINLQLVKGYFNIYSNTDAAAENLKKIGIPKFNNRGPVDFSNFEDLIDIFYYSHILLETTDIEKIEKNINGIDSQIKRNFIYFLFKISKIKSKLEYDEVFDYSFFSSFFEEIFQFFSKKSLRNISFDDSCFFRANIQIDFFKELLSYFSNCNESIINWIFSLFKNQWSEESKKLWDSSVIRSILYHFIMFNISKEKIIPILEDLENWMCENKDVSGKIEEHISQLDFWYELDDKHKVSVIFENLQTVSFGVGYRKDYQLEWWVKWLDEYLKKFKYKSYDLIQFFAKGLKLANESTEGAGLLDSSHQLLRIAYRVNENFSFKLLNWLKKNSIISHFSGIKAILLESLEDIEEDTEVIFTYLLYIFIPLSKYGYYEITYNLFLKLLKLHKLVDVIKKAEKLITQIKIYGLESGRFDWLLGIALAFKVKNQSDKISLNLEEILQVLEKNSSYFDKRPIELILSENVEKPKYEIKELITELNENKEPNSWLTFYDGGTRSAIFSEMNKLDPVKTRKIAYSDLKKLFHEKFINDYFIGSDLFKICNILEDNLPISEIWAEIYEYLNKLFNSEINFPKYTFIENNIYEENNKSNELMELIVDGASSPINLMQDFSLKAILFMLLNNNATLVKLMKKKLLYDENLKEPLLISLNLAKIDNKDLFQKFKGTIKKIKRTKYYSIRYLINLLITDMDNKGQKSHFTMKLTKIKRNFKNIFKKKSLKKMLKIYEGINSDNYIGIDIDFFSPFNEFIEEISHISNLNPFMIYSMCSDLLKKNGIDSDFCILEDVNLNKINYKEGFELPCIKTKIRYIRLAIYEILLILIDTNILTKNPFKYVGNVIGFYDFNSIKLNKIIRPKIIERISNLDSIGAPRSNWIENIPDLQPPHFYKKKFILMEYSNLQRFDWKKSNEMRIWCRFPANHSPFTKINIDQQDYKKCIDRDHFYLAKLFPNYFILSPYSHWIAFNPKLAFDMGWKLSQEGNFRWVDKHNNIMIETVIWQDGILEFAPPDHRIEAGYGSLIIASENAVKLIENRFGILTERGIIKRKKTEKNIDEYNHRVFSSSKSFFFTEQD